MRIWNKLISSSWKNEGNFFKDLVINNLSQGLQFGTRWVLNLTLIAVLDIESYALFSFIYSFSNILLSVIPFGSSTYLIARANNSEIGEKSFVESIIISSIIVGVWFVLYLVLSPLLGFITGWSFIIYGIGLSFLLSLNLVIFSFFKGVGEFSQELKAYFIFGCGLLIFTGHLYFIEKSITDIRIIFWVLIGLNAVILGYSFLFTDLTKRIDFSLKKLETGFKNIQFGFKNRKYFGLQDIVTAIYSQAGLLILFYLIDEKTYGYYRALFVVVAPIFMITVALSQVILRHLTNAKPENTLSAFRRIQRYTFLFGVIICLSLMASRGLVFSFINIESDSISIVSYFLIIAITFMRFIFSNYEMLLVVYDMQKQRFLVMAVAAIISIASIFLLLPRFGLVGAVSTNAISYIIVLFGLILITEKRVYSQKT